MKQRKQTMKRMIAIYENDIYICDNADEFNQLVHLKGNPTKLRHETGVAYSDEYRPIDPKKDLGRCVYNANSHNYVSVLGTLTEININKKLENTDISNYTVIKTTYIIDGMKYDEDENQLLVKKKE